MTTWADVIGWIGVVVGLVSALLIVCDEVARRRRHRMGIMNIVHPVTALYLGPIWLWAYIRFGPPASVERYTLSQADTGVRRPPEHDPSRTGTDPGRWEVASAISHCGTGCTLGDISGEWVVWALGPWTIGSLGSLGPEYALDFIAAWVLGAVIQYVTLVTGEGDRNRRAAIWRAIRVDTFSILSFQIGLFGWMAFSHLVVWHPPLSIPTSTHWFMMQVGMMAGFCTAWPVNRWLISKGWKKPMHVTTPGSQTNHERQSHI